MNAFCPPRHFRRDANIKPAPGTIIAEFSNGEDARTFARLKGAGFYVSPGINHVFAVRTALPESTATLNPLSTGEASRPAHGAGFSLRALTPRGEAALPELQRLLRSLS